MRRFSLLVLAACSHPHLAPDAGAGISVRDSTVTIKTGDVGQEHTPGTYVFADVANDGDVDRIVHVGGRLAGSDLVGDELRVPAHQARTFALVASGPMPDATSAELTIVSARPITTPDPIGLKDVRFKDGAIEGTVANTTQSDATGISVAATFYDAQGKILARPYTLLTLAARTQRAIKLIGPRDADHAVMFVAQSMYW
jgi:hypothetical protein